jgi:hypothetical protein
MASPHVRQQYQVEYRRQGSSNRWSAKIRRNWDLDSARGEFAPGYVCPPKEGETAEEIRAFVNVIVPSVFQPDDVLPSHDARSIVREVVQGMADTRFRAVHPGAVIEHAKERASEWAIPIVPQYAVSNVG